MSRGFCEISFTHAINSTPNTVIGGRVDHGVGIAFLSHNAEFIGNRRFHSLLLCVEAKIKGNLESAYGQLVTYLACLHESRINRGKRDSSVYGAATDGLEYVFVTITHKGVLRFSRQFDATKGDLPIILGCLRYILEKAIAMSPNSFPLAGASASQSLAENQGDNDIDEGLTPDNSSYLEGYGFVASQ